MQYGFQRNPKGLFVPSPGGLPGFQRQGMDQRKKNGSGLGGGWSPVGLDASLSLSNGNYTVAALSAVGVFANVQLTTAHNAGRWYLEVTNTVTQAQNGGAPGVAIVVPGFNTATYTENGGGTTFTTYNEARDDANNVISSTLDVWNQAGDVFCLAVDLDNRKVYGRKAGGSWNGSGADPAVGVGGFAMGVAPRAVGANVTLAGMPYINVVNFFVNTGQLPFSGAIPAGFSTW